ALWGGAGGGGGVEAGVWGGGDAKAAHVVVGHGAGPAGQGDRSHRLEVQGGPQLRAVGQVDVVDLDRQDAEAAAAAELRLVRGGLPTGDLAVERGAAERLGQRPAGLAAGRGRRRGAGDGERERPGRGGPGRVGHGHGERGGPGGGGRAEQQPGRAQRQPGRRVSGPGVRGGAAAGQEGPGEEVVHEHV